MKLAMTCLLLVAMTTSVQAGDLFKEIKKAGGEAQRGLGSVGNKFKKEVGNVANNVKREVGQVGNNVKREARNAGRYVDKFRQNARTAFRFQSNKSAVQTGIYRQTQYVVWGKELDFREYGLLATALATSVASQNPGPAMQYLNAYVVQTQRTLVRNLRAQGQRLTADVRRILIDALNRSLRTGRLQTVQIQGISMRVGIATYKNWKEASAHVPGGSIRNPKMVLKRWTVPLPNTHQPYIAFGVRFRQ